MSKWMSTWTARPLGAVVVIALLQTGLIFSGPRKGEAATIVYSNDVLGELEPCGCRSNPTGGLLRKAALLESLKKDPEKGPLLQLDAGDLLFDSEIIPDALQPQAEVQARALLLAHESLGQDAFVPGEKDFALGTRKLRALLKAAHFRALAANLVDRKTGKAIFPASHVFRLGKLRIAVIGIVGSGLRWPQDVRVTSEAEALKREIRNVQSKKPHLIVALTHQGLDQDHALVKAVRGVDVVIGAHTQSFLQKPEKETHSDRETLILQSSFRNQWIGVLPLDPKTGKARQADHQLISLDPSFEPEGDPSGIRARISKFKEEVAQVNRSQANNQAVAKLSAEQKEAVPSHQTFPKCAECHLKQFDFWRKTPHGKSYIALLDQKQAENQACIGCHSVGFQKPSGWNQLSHPAELQPKTEPTDGKTSQPAPLLALDPEGLRPYLESLHEESSLKSQVRLAPIAPEKIQLLEATRRLSRVWVNVQCESCHGPAGEHPFGSAPYPKAVAQETCLKCHSQERAPQWYGKNGQVDEGRWTESLKKMGCPAGSLNEADLE